MRETIRESATAGALLVVVGGLAVLTGRPFLFPSLGPSAFLLATRPTAGTSTPRRVFGEHLLGLAAGLLAYHALASGVVITTTQPPLSVAAIALAASGVLSVVLTPAAMVATDPATRARLRDHPHRLARTALLGDGRGAHRRLGRRPAGEPSRASHRRRRTGGRDLPD